MLTIHKYYYNGFEEISMPEGAKILSVQPQDRDIVIWVEVDTTAAIVIRHFEVVGTGHEFETPSESRKYIATVQAPDGYVWHVFELLEGE